MANNPTLMSMPICRDAEKNTIPATDNGTTGKFSEQYGWQSINSLPLSAGGKAVERLDFNGVLGLLGGIDYMTQRGYTFEYDNTLPYIVGCIVIDPLDGKTYRNINDVPAGSPNPSLDPANWVVYDIADYVGGALRVTTYSVGDTSTLPNIPAGYFLECTTAGTTATTAPNIPNPLTVDDTITDGTAVWTVRRCLPNSGGKFTSGTVNYSSDDITGRINFGFGSDGGNINIFGKNNADLQGGTAFSAVNGTQGAQFNLWYDGRMQYYPDLVNAPNKVYNLEGSAIVAKSLGENSYIKFASGIIWQFGFATPPSSSVTSFTVTLPITFPTRGRVFITPITGTYRGTSILSSVTSDGTFTIYADIASYGMPSFDWFAIGY